MSLRNKVLLKNKFKINSYEYNNDTNFNQFPVLAVNIIYGKCY